MALTTRDSSWLFKIKLNNFKRCFRLKKGKNNEMNTFLNVFWWNQRFTSREWLRHLRLRSTSNYTLRGCTRCANRRTRASGNSWCLTNARRQNPRSKSGRTLKTTSKATSKGRSFPAKSSQFRTTSVRGTSKITSNINSVTHLSRGRVKRWGTLRHSTTRELTTIRPCRHQVKASNKSEPPRTTSAQRIKWQKPFTSQQLHSTARPQL